MKKIGKQLLLAAGIVFGASANAAVITDIVEGSDMPYGGKVSAIPYQSVGYFHDLTDNPGFSLGSVISGTITIELEDDNCWLFGCNGDFPEAAIFTIAGFDFETGGFVIGTDSYSSALGVTALADANAGGVAVEITPFIGDFFVTRSTLELVLEDVGSAVSSPAPLGLLGLGLAALALRRRRSATR